MRCKSVPADCKSGLTRPGGVDFTPVYNTLNGGGRRPSGADF
jgi:hypothetical protein